MCIVDAVNLVSRVIEQNAQKSAPRRSSEQTRNKSSLLCYVLYTANMSCTEAAHAPGPPLKLNPRMRGT